MGLPIFLRRKSCSDRGSAHASIPALARCHTSVNGKRQPRFPLLLLVAVITGLSLVSGLHPRQSSYMGHLSTDYTSDKATKTPQQARGVAFPRTWRDITSPCLDILLPGNDTPRPARNHARHRCCANGGLDKSCMRGITRRARPVFVPVVVHV